MRVKKTKRKIGVKYIIAAIIIAIFSAFYVFDIIWAKTYDVKVVYVSDDTPVASNSERVEIIVQVMHFGKPMSNHEVFVLPSAGSMLAYTALTDEEGKVSFYYIPYTASAFNPAQDVVLKIRDQSNSVFWEISANTELVLKLR